MTAARRSVVGASLLLATILHCLVPVDAQIQAPANATAYGNQWACNNGYKRVGDHCEEVKVPPHATAYGDQWACNNGYRKSGEHCEEVQVPPHATAYGDQWACNNGYRKSGEHCEEVQVPAHATAYGDQWACNNGYRKSGDHCEEVKVPPHATAYGDQWACNNGYRKSGDHCEEVQAPPHATIYGDRWTCNNGYKKVGDVCIEMSPEEARQQQQQLVEQARRAMLDSGTVWESKIDDDKGDIIILENGGVVKVTSGYVGYIGYRKDSVLFKDGTSWKIWIEGKRAFSCDLLKRPSSGSTSAERLTIDKVASGGDILIASNGAVFEVSSGSTSSGWTSGASVLLLGGSRMLNLDAGEVVEVSRLR